MLPDIEEYREYVDQFDLTEAQKIELIHTVWRIMESFVDQAFGVHPVQQVMDSRSMQDSNSDDDQVSSNDQSYLSNFNRIAQKIQGEK